MPPPPPEFRVDVGNNQNSKIIVAAGSVTMTSKPQLPVTDIPQTDLDAVRQAWVEVSVRDERVLTASEAIGRLTGGGPRLAVVAGPPGYGKRAAGIKALWEVSQAEERSRGQALRLQEIVPDWERPGSPDIAVLPDEPGTCYLLDVAAEIGSWQKPGYVAEQLVSYSEELKFSGSFLVVIADEHGWPETVSGTVANVVARATARPSAHRVARAHLEYVHRRPDRIRWLNAASADAGSAGEAAHLLSDSSRPADAARLATTLSSADDSPEGLKKALSSFQEWCADVKDVFTKTEDKPDDRALLISSLFLNGKDALTVQDGARTLLGESPETNVRTILTGPDLTARLTAMGAEVNGRTVSLDHKSGYARAVLLHLWQQRADIHPHLLRWLDTITAPKEPGADRLAAIGDLLVELAVAENDIRVVKQIHAWIDNGDNSPGHRKLIARVLTVAAEADTLGAEVRALLLDSAQDESEAVATVVALVCQGEFAQHYPRQALVRLRHILDRPNPDEAVRTAQEALRDIAARDGQLSRVWSTVIKWATEKKHLAGHRAFLSLLDPRVDPYVLQVMLAAAEQKKDIREALVDGWNAALADTRVAADCRQLLTAWAEMRKTADVPTELMTEIINQVVLEHLYATPVSALIFGEPGVADGEAVIDLRKDLRLPPALSSLLSTHERASVES
ncbi:hypothetical protein B7755_006825 [Streptomyces sp. NBS 14/10]|uniref:hypothetical protein n=1 Tax=Streptomyces sp. NBS 14/10 TaxID=1945643 RepID=UPI00117E24BF|nr:hypothetical protein [Streptomyces sp. NBS 14/10]KAK1177898.1 hypothetical protein B7755_006825 [Streptomyces sp. NBS 14/10]